MSLWSKLKERFAKDEPAPVAPPPPKPAPKPKVETSEDELAALGLLAAGEEVPTDLALAELSRARGTSNERAALDRLLRARAARPLDERLAIAAADLFVQRGQIAAALELLDGASSTDALMMAADLRAERGEVAAAITLVERVLVRDIDAPGARERHERWRRWLGGAAPKDNPLNEATVLRADAPETTLRIVGEAGRGGAGTVYEAVDDVLGRRVALKVYHRPEDEHDKLEREARLAVTLAGRGVVRVFDVDPVRGWIVMEWLPAGALKRWLVQKDADFLWPIERWLAPLALAVARVHERGFVHADLKPANVLFRHVDEPVISDFGLAHPVGQVVAGGSRGYLSPERLSGEPITPADDVYALGRILEDALNALGERDLGSWRHGVALALASAEERPRDARALLRAWGL